MHGFGHASILISSFHGHRWERLGPQPPFCALNTKEKNSLQTANYVLKESKNVIFYKVFKTI